VEEARGVGKDDGARSTGARHDGVTIVRAQSRRQFLFRPACIAIAVRVGLSGIGPADDLQGTAAGLDVAAIDCDLDHLAVLAIAMPFARAPAASVGDGIDERKTVIGDR